MPTERIDIGEFKLAGFGLFPDDAGGSHWVISVANKTHVFQLPFIAGAEKIKEKRLMTPFRLIAEFEEPPHAD